MVTHGLVSIEVGSSVLIMSDSAPLVMPGTSEKNLPNLCKSSFSEQTEGRAALTD